MHTLPRNMIYLALLVGCAPEAIEGPPGATGPEGPAGEAVDPTEDSDDDGWKDWEEIAVGTVVDDPDSVPVDSNADGVADFFQGAVVDDPSADSDGDGWVDWVERAAETDPGDATDFPVDLDGDGLTGRALHGQLLRRHGLGGSDAAVGVVGRSRPRDR